MAINRQWNKKWYKEFEKLNKAISKSKSISDVQLELLKDGVDNE